MNEDGVESVRHRLLFRAHEGLEIQVGRILDELVDFAAVEAPIVVEALELKRQDFGRFVNGETLPSRHFAFAVGAKIGVVAVQQLRRDELLQTARYRR